MKRNILFSASAVLAALLVAAAPVHAQATRTWVSGVGDDANPCSRTAPCKTFAGAISKTAAGGEINVLDPGGFGAVTITKALTISSERFEAGVLVSGTNGIIVNAGITDSVTLRGLDIEGLGTGLVGIKVLQAGVVHVENCTIKHFTQNGIDFVPSSVTPGSTSQLHVSNTIIRDNTGASSGGIRIKPGTNVSATGMIENTQLRNNQFGLRVEDNSNVTAKTTTAASNAGSGFIAVSVGAVVTLNLDNCVATGNMNGIKSDNNTNATVRIAQCMISGNTNGLVSTAGAKIISFTGTNYNSDTGSPTGPNIAPQ